MVTICTGHFTLYIHCFESTDSRAQKNKNKSLNKSLQRVDEITKKKKKETESIEMQQKKNDQDREKNCNNNDVERCVMHKPIRSSRKTEKKAQNRRDIIDKRRDCNVDFSSQYSILA